jgi:tetratricopeptide (TPR) repeat protein
LPPKGSKRAHSFSAFISHAKADAKKAQEIAASLEERGLKCWIAPRDVRAGRAYGDEIIRGIESAQSFVLVLSKASNASAFVAREVERATSKKKPLFAVRLANVEPAPSLELFISGTQWIDAFPGRLSTHIGRLADLLTEEEGPAPEPRAEGKVEERRSTPRWMWPAASAASVLIVIVAGLAVWRGHEQISDSPETPETLLITKPVWQQKQEWEAREQIAAAEAQERMAAARAQEEMAAAKAQEQMAAAEASGDTEMIVGGKPATETGAYGIAGSASDLAAANPDFRACEKSSGDDAIVACDRAIASGKFTGRGLSYLYSDRGFMRMQKGELELALADLNEAARIDSTNFYAYWNRGAVYAAKGDPSRAQEDFTTALALNPDKTSRAKIEEALNAVAASANAANAAASDPSVITDPSAFGGQTEGSASAASSYPVDAMPASPPAAYMPAAPAAPPPAPVR